MKAPSSVGSQELIAQLPSGTICSGGPSKDLCLVSFKTAGGFGNCVVLQQAPTGSASCKVGKQKRADSDQIQSKRDLIDSRATVRIPVLSEGLP
ncbi:hypothetical protein PHLCEN_2v1182 [Hermanssonia centrifuga]|uniref:Uncharacterized protein n=1 Tax=Hermanssonia centrifuga TaxID=98765 RepID=A0A2R6S3W4_9APHY|nr:hypothetical protein PHLCEN_2v1182 [Hermanssonia centrifuga]